MSFRERLTSTVQDAVLFAVRWIVVIALALGAGSWIVMDYLHVRALTQQSAQNWQALIDQQRAAQQAQGQK